MVELLALMLLAALAVRKSSPDGAPTRAAAPADSPVPPSRPPALFPPQTPAVAANDGLAEIAKDASLAVGIAKTAVPLLGAGAAALGLTGGGAAAAGAAAAGGVAAEGGAVAAGTAAAAGGTAVGGAAAAPLAAAAAPAAAVVVIAALAVLFGMAVADLLSAYNPEPLRRTNLNNMMARLSLQSPVTIEAHPVVTNADDATQLQQAADWMTRATAQITAYADARGLDGLARTQYFNSIVNPAAAQNSLTSSGGGGTDLRREF